MKIHINFFNKNDSYVQTYHHKKKIFIMELIQGIWMVSLMNGILMLPWTLVFLLVRGMGVRLYHLRNREDCRRLQKRVGNQCTHLMDGKMGCGYAVGRWYIVSMNVHRSEFGGDSYDIWLIATEKTYEDLIRLPHENQMQFLSEDEKEMEKKHTKPTMIYERIGSFNNCFFQPRTVHLDKLRPLPHQIEILQQILQHQKKHRHTVVYLHGPPGAGKSVLSLLAARDLSGSYCNTLKPWQPGDNIGELHSEIEPSESNPLILVFDEFEGPLLRIHSGIPPHNKIPISIPDKTGWNRMLDEIQWGLFPHIILFLTSNKPPSFIQKLDESYIREGRVDLIFAMEKQSV